MLESGELWCMTVNWCNCQAVEGTINYPGPWHPVADQPWYPCALDHKTITKGELLALLADVPNDTPLTVFSEDRGWYMNLSLIAEDVQGFRDEDLPSIALTEIDDYDTRQW